MKNLRKGIKRLKKENKDLLQEANAQKRASTIINQHEEMKNQDIVIEILRNLIKKDKEVDFEITKKMSLGPKRIRPKSREELRMELRKYRKEVSELTSEYYKQFPEKNPDFYKEKEVQTDEFVLGMKIELFFILNFFLKKIFYL